ncbi:MAG TPA: hypothetical protein VFS08_07405 [Gemmatimonadaceae bacterium]|nr:hypothetical protein [Gemmatimonadaceae bacterium]
MLASVFEFLFKYRPVVFERGELVFTAGPTTYAVVALGLLLALPAFVGTARLRAGATRRDRVVLLTLRALALLVLAGCLFRPALLLSAAAPQRNVLAVLVDDSRSMRIADADGRPRAEVVQRLLDPAGPLVRQLGDRFTLRTFAFSQEAARAPDVNALAFDGSRSRVEAALRSVRQQLAGVPLAGIVLVTDGADNAPAAPAGALVGAAGEVPVYTVGVGGARFARDIEVARIDVPAHALRGGTIAADVTLTQSGLAGEQAQLIVEDEGRVVASQSVALPRDGEVRPIRVPIPATEAGVRRITVRVVPRTDEQLVENNAREALVGVRDRRERILYVEGEPRFEFKFLRRAVAGDEQLQVVGLQRTAEDKFLRLGVDDSTQLRAGFPTTREELFAYRAVILGSIEASYFTAEQLRLLADFVSERGGGLLALGGRRSFREGGWAGTPVGEVLPLLLDEGQPSGEDTDGPPTFLAELHVMPTPAGLGHAVTQVAATPEASAERWKTLPALTTVNRVRGLKPGAVTLLAAGSGDEETPVLAYQRYGRGVAMALPVQDTWLWQMHADIAVDDQTHERFWRQLLRWLVSDVPDRETVLTSAERLGAGEPVTLRADVRDSAFHGVRGATVVAHVTTPSGAVRDVPLTATGEADGDYRALFMPAEDGEHLVRVTADAGGEQTSATAAFVRSSDGAEEYFEAGLRAPFLQRLADETGGRYYTPATASALPRDVVYTRSGNTVLERKELWDMPVVLLVLVGLLGAEWGYRRARGLV